jgi:trimeric autotransporter adhesin
MKKQLILLNLLGTIVFADAQNVGIGTATPHPSAQLDISSTTGGFLVPRMTSAQRNAITSPAGGLLVFDTDTNSFWYVASGVGWINLTTGSSGWLLTGNAGADTAINFIGTSDNWPLKFKVNNQRSGLITASGNVFWGPGSGSNTFVTDNIAIGTNALSKNFSPSTIAIGASALSNNTSGYENTAVGFTALEANTTGLFNAAFGNYSLRLNTTGGGNTALGTAALPNHLTGYFNTAIGTNALFYDTTGSDNTALGHQALFNNFNGSGNTAIGKFALQKNKTGSNNIGLGYRTDLLFDSLQNAAAIGTFARVDCSNCMVLGSVAGVNGASSNVNVGIGINNPARPLSFPAYLGKKISLYPGTIGEAGFGIFGNELRIHSDYLGADITFGSDDYTLGFAERMRIINVGAEGMVVNGRLHLKNGTTDPSNSGGVWLYKADNSALLGFMGTQNNQNIGFYGGSGGWGFVYEAINSRVGIGTATPLSRLHVVDSSVLFSAVGTVTGSPSLPPQQGAGRRMMWYPDKSAFRVGYVSNTQWDKDSTGNYSFASGYSSKAKGTYSTALGFSTNATGDYSTALGRFATASGVNSLAMGFSATASGDFSLATGSVSNASGDNSTTMGDHTTSSGSFSVAMGYNTTSKAVGSFVTGLFNDISDNPLPQTTFDTDRLFQIGNGASNVSRSNAVTVLKNGNTGIGTTTPGFLLEVNGTAGKPGGGSWSVPSDARLKENVTPYGDGLSTLLKIKPVKYHYNQLSGFDTNPEYIGVLAQDIKSIAPYMVGSLQKKGETWYSVDNSAMTYMLINAVKEQQSMIDKQQQQIDELKKLVQQLVSK